MNRQFRIKKLKRKIITSIECGIYTHYQIQELKKFLWFNPSWKPFRSWNFESWETVDFLNLSDAKEYLKNLKEIMS